MAHIEELNIDLFPIQTCTSIQKGIPLEKITKTFYEWFYLFSL